MYLLLENNWMTRKSFELKTFFFQISRSVASLVRSPCFAGAVLLLRLSLLRLSASASELGVSGLFHACQLCPSYLFMILSRRRLFVCLSVVRFFGFGWFLPSVVLVCVISNVLSNTVKNTCTAIVIFPSNYPCRRSVCTTHYERF